LKADLAGAASASTNASSTNFNAAVSMRAVDNYEMQQSDRRPIVYFNPKKVLFKLVNEHKPNQLNCFMNAIIQAVWNIDSLRGAVVEFTKKTQALTAGPPEFMLVREVQNLFHQANQDHKALQAKLVDQKAVSDVPILNANNLRKELFKYYYA
jgi:hypothetical protein